MSARTRVVLPPTFTPVTFTRTCQPWIAQCDEQGNPAFHYGHRPTPDPSMLHRAVVAADYWPVGQPMPDSDEPWPVPNRSYKRWRRIDVPTGTAQGVVLGHVTRSDGFFFADGPLQSELRVRLLYVALSHRSHAYVHVADTQVGFIGKAGEAA